MTFTNITKWLVWLQVCLCSSLISRSSACDLTWYQPLDYAAMKLQTVTVLGTFGISIF